MHLVTAILQFVPMAGIRGSARDRRRDDWPTSSAALFTRDIPVFGVSAQKQQLLRHLATRDDGGKDTTGSGNRSHGAIATHDRMTADPGQAERN